jgi:hypothetical protein
LFQGIETATDRQQTAALETRRSSHTFAASMFAAVGAISSFSAGAKGVVIVRHLP